MHPSRNMSKITLKQGKILIRPNPISIFICTTLFHFYAAKLVPVGYGIKKLQINCVIEDDKVSTDFLEEEITAIEELVGYS